MAGENYRPPQEELDWLDAIIDREIELQKAPKPLGQKVLPPVMPGGGGIEIELGEEVVEPRGWHPPMQLPLPPVDRPPQGPPGFNWGDIQQIIEQGNGRGFAPVIPPN